MNRTLIAAPGYATKHKKAHKPEDLLEWDWIGLNMLPASKILINQSNNRYQINYKPRINADNVEAVCQLALAGLGLATPPTFLVEEAIKTHRLIKVLPTWQVSALNIYAVWPPNSSRDSLTLRFINFLEKKSRETSVKDLILSCTPLILEHDECFRLPQPPRQ